MKRPLHLEQLEQRLCLTDDLSSVLGVPDRLLPTPGEREFRHAQDPWLYQPSQVRFGFSQPIVPNPGLYPAPEPDLVPVLSDPVDPAL